MTWRLVGLRLATLHYVNAPWTMLWPHRDTFARTENEYWRAEQQFQVSLNRGVPSHFLPVWTELQPHLQFFIKSWDEKVKRLNMGLKCDSYCPHPVAPSPTGERSKWRSNTFSLPVSSENLKTTPSIFTTQKAPKSHNHNSIHILQNGTGTDLWSGT